MVFPYCRHGDVARVSRPGARAKVIDTLVAQIRDRAPDNPYITHIADPPGWRLYEQTGFTEIDPSRGMELPWMRW